MKKLYFLILTLLCTLPGFAQEMTLVNDQGSSMGTFSKETDGSYTLSLDELTGLFKIQFTNGSSTTKYGKGTGLTLGTEVNLSTRGGFMSMSAPKVKEAKITVTMNAAGNPAIMKVTGTPEYSGSVYLYGSVKASEWEASESVKLTGENGVYSLNNVEFVADTEANDGLAYFCFASKEGTLETDGQMLYCPSTADYPVKVFEQTPFVAKDGNYAQYFTIAPGIYTVKFDFNTNYIEVDLIPQTLSIVGTLGINGVIGSTNPSTGIQLTKGTDNMLHADGVIIGGAGTTGYGSFFFVEKTGADWSATGYQFGPENNNTSVTVNSQTGAKFTRTQGQPAFSVPQGIYDITVDPATMTVYVDKGFNQPIVDMTAIGTTGNYVNENPGSVSQFIIRVGDELYGHTAQTTPQIGEPITLEKLNGNTIPYIGMTTSNNPQGFIVINDRMLFFDSESKNFIAVPKNLILNASASGSTFNADRLDMTYNPATGTFEGTVPYVKMMVIGSLANGEIVYGAPATLKETDTYNLTADGYSALNSWIADEEIKPFLNKIVEFNPLAMTLTVKGDANEKPEITTVSSNVEGLSLKADGKVFSGVAKLAKDATLYFTGHTANHAVNLGITPAENTSLGLNQPVSVSYTVNAPNTFTFTGEEGYYTVKVNLDNMTVMITELPGVTTFADMESAQGGYFTGTATCEFNYQDDNGHELWLKDAAGTALQFDMTAMDAAGNDAAGFDLSVLKPAHFNRGNTITKFRAVKNGNVYVITEFTVNNYQSGNELKPAPEIGAATNVDIDEAASLTDNLLNTMVQIKGNVWFTSSEQYIMAGTTKIPIIYEFKAPIDMPVTAPMMAEGTATGWTYGQAVPDYTGQELYVAGIVTKDASGNLGINVTAISDATITGVETTEIDAETIVDVYNMQGMVVRRAVKYGEATLDLPAGIYIVAGRKLMVR